jgi:hypothetical protein
MQVGGINHARALIEEEAIREKLEELKPSR